ncbi:MAG: hypothetical protein ACPHCJ_07385 [Oceanococcaceae bacterium]
MAKPPLHPRAQALLEAHVAYIMAECRGQALRRQIRVQVEGVLEDVEDIPLGQLLERDTLSSVAVNIVQHLELGPDLATLVGEIARQIYGHSIHRETTLTELFPDAAVEVLVDQVLELKELRRALLHEAVANPVFSAMLAEILLAGIRDFMASNPLTAKVPGAQSALKVGRSLVNKARPQLGEAVEAQVRQFVEKQTRFSLEVAERFLRDAVDDGALRAVVMDTWEKMRDKPVSHYRDMVTVDQVESLAMLGTAFWRDFRGSDFAAAMIEAAVDGFYTRHAENPVGDVLQEIGVTRDLLRGALNQLLPELLKNLGRSGALESVARRLLEDFYASEAVQAIVAD